MLRPCTTNCYRILFKLNSTTQKFTVDRNIHFACRTRLHSLKVPRTYNSYHRSNILGTFFIRYASTNETVTENPISFPETSTINTTSTLEINTSKIATNSIDSNDLLNKIPDIPTPPEEIIEVVKQFHPNGEMTFQYMGLGGYSPVGIIQNCLEFLHISLDLPWWSAIAIGTICIRLLMFPLIIIAQRNVAKMNNLMPKMQEIQLELTEARQAGNRYEATLYALKLHNFMKKEGLSPWKNFIVTIVQAPLFISCFMALKSMANVPVESLKTGGLWWFADLTIPDPYYILPVITTMTVFITFELGTDAMKASNMQNLKYALRVLPFLIFPFTMNFPAAVLCHWTTTNTVSLVQAIILKIPRIRTFFKIPPLIEHKTEKQYNKNRGIITGAKEAWTNMKIAQQLANRERADLIQFENAGRGPIKKTYKYDPTKQNKTDFTVLAKKR